MTDKKIVDDARIVLLLLVCVDVKPLARRWSDPSDGSRHSPVAGCCAFGFCRSNRLKCGQLSPKLLPTRNFSATSRSGSWHAFWKGSEE